MLQTAAIFQDNMILQREKSLIVWGTGTPGETVYAYIQGKMGKAMTDQDGNWRLEIPPLAASEGESLFIKSEDDEITYEQVAVGEVWLAGGQSNMEFWIRYERHKEEAFQNCPDPVLRFYDVPEISYDGQLEEFDYSRQGFWRKATKEDLEYFSAVGYYFQKELKDKLNVPVGIIGCNWGGTPACAWMNPQTVRTAGEPWMKDYEDKIASMDMEKYWKDQHGNPMNDRGNPFADPFGELVLPGTAGEEELKAFFSQIPDNFEDYIDLLQPQSIPGSLYEHMLKTIAPFVIKGFLWYQGESDDVPGRNVLYKDMLSGLISDWRRLWGDESLPFLVVQLPGFDCWLMNNQKNHYPVIRRCQEAAADAVNDTYLCSISDVGEERDIHPKDKKTVGHRLALLAQKHVYGRDVICDAPRAKSIKQIDDSLIIMFDHAEGGLYIKGDRLNALQITAGEEELQYTASTKENHLIIRLNDPVKGALKVRFAQTPWYQVNLYNKAEIPAIPFEISL